MKRKKPRRKQGAFRRSVTFLMLLAAMSAGTFWSVKGDDISQHIADGKMSSIEEPRDNGADASYTETSIDVQRAVDSWLTSQGAEVKQVQTEDRTERRKATGGTIQWTTRSKEVVPAREFTKEDLEKQLAKSGGKAVLYHSEQTRHDGKDVTEYDIARFDMLDGEQLYLVTDRLYVTALQAKPTLVEKIKKLILRSTSGSLKDSTAPSEEKQNAAPVDKQQHPAQIKGRLAIVIDDCGSSMDNLKLFNDLPIPLTYAVMPNKMYTQEAADSGYEAGRKIFVHLPMEAQKVGSSENVYIKKDMPDGEVKKTAKSLIGQVPHAIGMNNHQGSAAIADERVMKDVLSVVKDKKMVYLDSRTSAASVGEQTASAMGIATSRNNLFLDNDKDVGAIKERLRQAGRIAVHNGNAIVIGHCRPYTAEALKEMIDELHREGVDIVFVTDLM